MVSAEVLDNGVVRFKSYLHIDNHEVSGDRVIIEISCKHLGEMFGSADFSELYWGIIKATHFDWKKTWKDRCIVSKEEMDAEIGQDESGPSAVLSDMVDGGR